MSTTEDRDSIGLAGNDKEFMTTLAKGLAVLGSFGEQRPAMTLSQAAAAADLTRATARRVLLTLTELGYVSRRGRNFSLAPRILELGFAYLSTQSWIDRAEPLMKELSHALQESCSAAILQGSEIVYVARMPAPHRIMSTTIAVGTRLPAFHTSLGRIQLGFLGAVPYVGDAIGGQNSIVWVMLLLVVVLQVFLFRTVAGLRLRAVGEHPRAAETVGIRIRRIRYAAVIASGALAALGGAYLSLGVAHSFTDGMTSGRGFIGLAAMIFGRWTPVGALVASLIFGYGNALSTSLQGATIGDAKVPVQLLGTLPYVLTILAVAGFVGRSRPPAADGVPYETEGHA